ncbi:MAG: MFS transporter [Sneathiella sp.]|jgi:MFS family permease|uniref:MFS transporter n=1 Tax=Sneathiella sp. TaxID=1964365 RepID=UPI000C366E29|nr:MFS transporter [Sneathiella sp.]MAL80057.1 MFS transporter [Sneathiella sp.]
MMDRRTKISILLMSGCQALLNSTTAIMISSAALVALILLGPDKSLATLPVTAVVTGTALATLPASLFMRRVGRQSGFIFGAGLGIFGAAICSYAVWVGNFWIFTIGAMFVGMYTAFGNYYRFAAVDVAGQANRSKAVSYVMAGGLIAGFLGPQIASHSRELFVPFLYLGTYLSVILLGFLAILLISLVRIPKMKAAVSDEPQRPMLEIIRQPTFIIAALSAMIGYGAMNLIMTATPLAMVGCGHDASDSFNVISWHVVAMFGPSFFTGSLIARFGEYRIIITGALLGIVCVAISLLGLELVNFYTALILLGVSWNFMFIGGTTLVTTTYRPSEAAKVQGMNDFLVFGTVATASLLSGQLQERFGWEMVNYFALPMFALVILMALLNMRGGRRQIAAAE